MPAVSQHLSYPCYPSTESRCSNGTWRLFSQEMNSGCCGPHLIISSEWRCLALCRVLLQSAALFAVVAGWHAVTLWCGAVASHLCHGAAVGGKGQLQQNCGVATIVVLQHNPSSIIQAPGCAGLGSFCLQMWLAHLISSSCGCRQHVCVVSSIHHIRLIVHPGVVVAVVAFASSRTLNPIYYTLALVARR